jgi:hypothetical protein
MSASRHTNKKIISNQDILETMMINRTGCKSGMTRRQFLTVTTSIPAFTIIPRHVPGGSAQTHTSEKLNIACGRFELYPEDKFVGVRHPRVPRKPSHADDWVEVCKTNNPVRPGTKFSYSGPLTETILLGIAEYRAGEKLFWDAKNLKITNKPEAERFIRRDTYRESWML